MPGAPSRPDGAGSDRVPLFVAADLPPSARAPLARHGAALVAAGGWRAIRDDALHLTLAFLGPRPAADVPAIGAALGDAVVACGPARLGDPVLLPRRAPRVAAVRLDDDGGLTALAASVGARLAALGVYEPERRPYLPHVTVARRTRAPLGDAPVPDWAGVAPFALPSVTLFRSRLSRAGAAYEALATVALPPACGRGRRCRGPVG